MLTDIGLNIFKIVPLFIADFVNKFIVVNET
jgi:hypothetical protein